MKIKVFSELATASEFEEAVNRWMAENNGIKIHHVAQSETEPSKPNPGIKLSIFYDQPDSDKEESQTD